MWIKFKKYMKKLSSWFYLKHSKMYTILILILGIVLGCMYEGKAEDNTHYFNIFGHTLYVGFIL